VQPTPALWAPWFSTPAYLLIHSAGIAVYVCDPHSPCQRDFKENMNKLLRQYLPKGTDLSVYSQEQLDAIADQINNRPRKGLGVRSPLAVYTELLQNSNNTQRS
jgi:IS30 family transposase